jgi:ATP-dependent Clp protease ATP-binding subunit ClpX
VECSFCHKKEKPGRRTLISSPSDYPRAYICSECVEVCVEILKDERGVLEAPPETPTDNDPVMAELLPAVEQWIVQESLGLPAHEELASLRETANRLLVMKP